MTHKHPISGVGSTLLWPVATRQHDRIGVTVGHACTAPSFPRAPTVGMSRLFKSLSSLVNGRANRTPVRDTADTASPDAGPSTITTPLFPLNGAHADAAPASASPASGARDPAAPAHALVPLAAQPTLQRSGRKAAASRALHAVVRATTQVPLASHVEPTPAPKVARSGHRSSVVLTETEKLRLQVMQVQLKLTALGLYEGPIDGMMNPELVDGVRHFQTLKGQRDTGMLTTGTLTALGIRGVD